MSFRIEAGTILVSGLEEGPHEIILVLSANADAPTIGVTFSNAPAMGMVYQGGPYDVDDLYFLMDHDSHGVRIGRTGYSYLPMYDLLSGALTTLSTDGIAEIVQAAGFMFPNLLAVFAGCFKWKPDELEIAVLTGGAVVTRATVKALINQLPSNRWDFAASQCLPIGQTCPPERRQILAVGDILVRNSDQAGDQYAKSVMLVLTHDPAIGSVAVDLSGPYCGEFVCTGGPIQDGPSFLLFKSTPAHLKLDPYLSGTEIGDTGYRIISLCYPLTSEKLAQLAEFFPDDYIVIRGFHMWTNTSLTLQIEAGAWCHTDTPVERLLVQSDQRQKLAAAGIVDKVAAAKE